MKLARAYLKTLPSDLKADPMKALSLFQRAVELSDEPDGHYGLASIFIHYASIVLDNKQSINGKTPQDESNESLIKAILHLQRAAMGYHPYAMFNLGIVYKYGYGNTGKNEKLSMEWFEASGLPEGFEVNARYLKKLGKVNEAEEYHKKAKILGYGKKWRKMARDATGYGGAGGVDINMNWPKMDGMSVEVW